MKESHEVRLSLSPRPRVMRGVRQLASRSVHRGTARLCMELRNHPFVVADPVTDRRLVADKGKATVMSSEYGEFDVAPTESETTRMVGNFPHGSREAPEASTAGTTVPVVRDADRSEKARCHTSDVYVSGESDSFIVPKQANKDSGSLSAESVEGRGLTKENVEQLLLDRTPRRASRSRGLLNVREAALINVRLWSSSSKVRAVCGSSARTDLCGGRSAMTVPTAMTERSRDVGTVVYARETYSAAARANPVQAVASLAFSWQRSRNNFTLVPSPRWGEGRVRGIEMRKLFRERCWDRERS